MPVVNRQLSIRCPGCGVKTLVSYKAKIKGEDYSFETDQEECPECETGWLDTIESLVEEDIEDHMSASIDKELERERHLQFVEALESDYYDD
jgi:hypothetical protein